MGRERAPAVYLMASGRRGYMYVGVTSDLVKRAWQHRAKQLDGYTKRYHIDKLVWYENHSTMESAITREKTLKRWKRDWKFNLIEASNPEWKDLSYEI